MESFLRKDRQIVVLSLALITVFAWVYLVALANEMDMTLIGTMKNMESMLALKPWTAHDAIFMFTMWIVMMVGMMIPSAAPMILLYTRVLRKNFHMSNVMTRTSAFFVGYLAVWVVFSAAATTAQWGLEKASLLSPMMVSTNSLFAGMVLIAAGIYQWTPYKQSCLKRCREPVWFLSRIWRDGIAGALTMGLIHGAFCVGCCWALMTILFVGGVMNILCVLAITIFVLLEKVTAFGSGFGKITGLALMGIGVSIIV